MAPDNPGSPTTGSSETESKSGVETGLVSLRQMFFCDLFGEKLTLESM